MVYYRKYGQGRGLSILPEMGAQQGREHQRAKMSDYTASVKALPTIYTLRTRKIGELGEHEKLNRISAPVQRASKKGTFLSAGSKK